jgi:hypothetical protein
LIAGYFLLVKNDVLKGNLSLSGKKFNPILGTPKQKDVVVNNEEEKKPDTIVPPDTTSPTPPNDTDTTNAGNKGDTGAVQPISKFVPPNMTFPQPKNSPFTPKNISVSTQCADGVDNDKDGSIDSADNDCHSDGNAKNLSSYVSTYKKEAGSKNAPIVPVTPDPKKKTAAQCTTEDVPLVFTEAEQRRLDELTREFYRLAPQLKSANDVVAEINAEQSYRDTINNAEALTKQCYDQTGTLTYLRNSIDTENLGKQNVLISNASLQNDPGLYRDILKLAVKGNMLEKVRNMDIKDILKDIKGFVDQLKSSGIDIISGNAAQMASKVKNFVSNVKSLGKNWQDQNVMSMVGKLQALGVSTGVDITGTEMKLIKLGIDPKANVNTVLSKLRDLGITDRTTTVPDKYQEVDVINLSTLNKGRTERVSGPYSSFIHKYGFTVTAVGDGGATFNNDSSNVFQTIDINTEPSYYGTYYIHPITKKFVTIWADWEKDWGVW